MIDDLFCPKTLVDYIHYLLINQKLTFGRSKTLAFVKAFLRNVETIEAFAIREEPNWELNNWTLNTVVVSYTLVRGTEVLHLEYQYILGLIKASTTHRPKEYLYQGHKCYIVLNTRGNTTKIDLDSRNLKIPYEKLPLYLNDKKLKPLIQAKLRGDL